MFEVIDEGALPVVLGIPNAGKWRLWSADDSFTCFVDDPVLTDILAWGRVSRLDIGDNDQREFGFLDRKNGLVQLMPRRQDALLAEGVPFRGHTVELSEEPARLQSGLHDIEEVLTSAIFHCAMAGGAFVVSPGSWNGWPGIVQPTGGDTPALVKCEVHQRSDWDEHIALATTPRVEGSSLWEASTRPTTDLGEAAVPLHGDGMKQAVDRMIEAVSRWGYAPEDLVLTFRGN